MKKILLTIAVLLLVAAGCGENQQATIWGLSSPTQDLTARVGLQDGNAEIGVTAKYVVADDVEWDQLTPDLLGPYLAFYPSIDASVTDEPSPAPGPIGPWLESLHAKPYFGMEVVGALEGKRSMQPNFFVGSVFTVDTASNIALVIEYLDGDMVDTGEVYIGGRLKF
jgi:hypothetical protein